MGKIRIACFLVLVALALKVEGDEISCSLFDKHTTSAKRCHFNSTVVISSSDTTIADAKDESVDALFVINYNLNVKFLPVNVYAKFPNVKSIHAVGCSIKEISKKNFASLNQLKSIVLNSNEITKVPSDTFQGLLQLAIINLGHNKIKSMNSAVFSNLPALDEVYLLSNVCINDNFLGKKKIETLAAKVDEKCKIDGAVQTQAAATPAKPAASTTGPIVATTLKPKVTSILKP